MSSSLIRAIGRRDLTAILINCVIGAGILGLPGNVFRLLGPYSVAAWVFCALIMGLVALCFAEVGSRFSATGGAYLYARTAFGPATGFMVGWLAWVSRLFSYATIGNLALTYAGSVFPSIAAGWPRLVCITVFTALLITPLVVGIRFSTVVNNVLTGCKLVLLFGFVLAMLPFFDVSRMTPTPLPPSSDWQTAMLQMTFAFMGMEGAMNNAGEMRNPRRDVPFALAVGLAVLATLYIAIQVACIGVVPDLAASQRPIVDAVTQTFGPVGGQFVAIGAVVTMLGTLFAVLLTSTRLLFAFAEQGQLPKVCAVIHSRFHTPHIAILLTGVLAWLFTVYSSFFAALTVTALTRLVGYVTTCAALIVLRKRSVASEPGFRVPAGPFVAVAGLAACGWLMASTTRDQVISMLIIASVGASIAGGYALSRGVRRGN